MPDASTDEDDHHARARAGLDALRHAASGDDHWSAPWRALLDARVRSSVGLWVVAVLAAVVLGVGGYALARRPGAPTSSSVDLPMATGTTGSGVGGSGGGGGSDDAGAAPTGVTAELVVQVAGAVAHPGVFHLPPGSRLGDLVRQAGGLTRDADVDRIDLAAPLTDGALVYLPRRGQALPPGPVVGGGGSTPGGTAGDGSSSTLVLDLNTATAEQLDALPGVGPTTAAAIVAYRDQHGPFRSVDDLADVTGIGPAKLAQIRPHVHL